MEKQNKIVFVVAQKPNGKLAYADNDLKPKDTLTLLAMVVSYVHRVATSKIGLTDEEAQKNIARAVETGVQSAKETKEKLN